MELRPLRVMISEIKPVLSVEPNSPQVFRGETVTLTCRISGGSGPYNWYKDGGYSHRSAENYYTIKVDQSHKYSCYVSIDGWSTPWSNEVILSVIERPKAVLTLQPDGQIFSGQEVTFTCEIRGHADTEWMYNWNKDGVQIFSYTKSRKYSFTPVESQSAKYTCSGRRRSDSQTSETSNTVTLTVSGVCVCVCVCLQSAAWKFYWIKPTQSTETETETDYYNISSVRDSDGGQYRCRAGRGNPVYYTHYSDALWVNVTGSTYNTVIVFVAVGLSLAFLFIILLLILHWWHKSNKGKDRDIQQNSNQTPGQNPSQSGAEDSQSRHTPLQTDVHIYATVENASKSDSAAEPSGAIYAQVMKKKESYKNKSGVFLYCNFTFYI
ncbi:high affinity immunoglobulin gamma Fc receptor I-like [Ictalurus furcatus]|uniref:high affinity immunoglobulin gamma Fc receptor I-like n=1 Tax=Ictalurus furcatus TaxID=66913 RepID=UPI002350C49D|nr:high affinity immunoglobulin gamma Fc receptor I-like [Ictalurus furcatus]